MFPREFIFNFVFVSSSFVLLGMGKVIFCINSFGAPYGIRKTALDKWGNYSWFIVSKKISWAIYTVL